MTENRLILKSGCEKSTSDLEILKIYTKNASMLFKTLALSSGVLALGAIAVDSPKTFICSASATLLCSFGNYIFHSVHQECEYNSNTIMKHLINMNRNEKIS